MSQADRWQLPEGVEEILPGDARRLEQLRRKVLDLFHSWGYEQVTPPLVEYTDSLLIGTERDLEKLTLKVTDQLTGRLMGLRADMTPQIARMDAHSWCQEGPSRFSYAGNVLHARPRSLMANRTPVQVGVELYGVAGLDGDIEITSLLLDTLAQVGIEQGHLDLGHVGIYRCLVEEAGLSDSQQNELFDLLQLKASTEVQQWLSNNLAGTESLAWFQSLAQLSGGREVLEKAREQFAEAPAEIAAAIDELDVVAEVLAQRYPNTELYFDLSEVRGYHYHSGIVFAAYVPGHGEAVANGGRYDYIGEVFGRGRPATGFSADLQQLMRLGSDDESQRGGIFVSGEDAELWAEAQKLRVQGERVIFALGEDVSSDGCDRQLVKTESGFEIKPLS
ncbi:MAG: ATP phosphoribosyltransferase regulatory subunit [Cellvibrionaceae bacterium]